MCRVALALVALVALAAPGPAAAHLRTSRVAVDYRAAVASLRAPVAGAVRARIYPADLAIGLTALGGHRVIVLGYLGEPFLRLAQLDGTIRRVGRPRSCPGSRSVSRSRS